MVEILRISNNPNFFPKSQQSFCILLIARMKGLTVTIESCWMFQCLFEIFMSTIHFSCMVVFQDSSYRRGILIYISPSIYYRLYSTIYACYFLCESFTSFSMSYSRYRVYIFYILRINSLKRQIHHTQNTIMELLFTILSEKKCIYFP